MEDETHSFVIKLSKPRVSAKESGSSISTIQRRPKFPLHVSARKPSHLSLQKYSLPGSQPLEVKKLENEVLLLPYRLFSKRQEFERHKTRLAISIYDKYRIVNTDLRRRLHVASPTDDVRGLKDIDPKFFHHVNGRRLKSGRPLYKSVGPEIKSLFKTRLHTSLRKDCALRLEYNMRKELQKYEISEQQCKKQAQYFDEFISEDYLSSIAFLNEWDALKTKLNLKEAELHSLANDKFYIMSRLIGLDYRYGVQQKYGRFLYYLSPPSWRANHRDFARSVEIEKKGFDLGYSSEEDPFTVIFEKLKQEIRCENRVTPSLYFQRPEDLMDMFETIEKQQLNYLTHVTYKSPYVRLKKKELATLKLLIQQSSHSVVTKIKEFEDIVERENLRCNFMEAKFHRIVNGMFYESVGSLEVLKLGLHLEYCYEKIMGEKPMNTGLKSVAHVLESCFMDYCMRLDEIHSDDIKKAVKHHIELKRVELKKAKVAARELRLFRRLEKELRHSCLPKDSLVVPLPVKPMHRSRTKVSRVRLCTNTKVSQQSLTEAEREYLALFTDWTEKEDPTNYLQALTTKKEHLPRE